MRLRMFVVTTVVVMWGNLCEARAEVYHERAPIEQYLMANRAEEISLARSAAPTAISSTATVLVLGQRGYETAAAGTNGFVCLVDRSWQAPFSEPDFWNPRVRSPVCLNPQAARSVLPLQHKRTELALAGLSKAAIAARLRAMAANGFGAPEIGAMSYMMSKEQYLSDRDGRWQPHVMFYLPGTVTHAAWGANLPASPVMGSPERSPEGHSEPIIIYVVTVGAWADGTPAAVDDRSHRH